MFLAGIIKTHADTQADTEQQPKRPAADESTATLDADAVADATWPSFKPRLTPGYFGRTTSDKPSRARWA